MTHQHDNTPGSEPENAPERAPGDDRLDTATAARLRKLTDAPVEFASLEDRLNEAMDGQAANMRGMQRVVRLRRVLALAASIALAAVVITSLIGHGGTPAQAATLDLTEIHHRLLDEAAAQPPITTIEQVNAFIAAKASLPADQLRTHVRSCCLRDVQGSLRAAVLLNQEGSSTSIVVADGENFAAPMGETVTVEGQAFHVHRMGELTMVMSRRDHRWLCVMGEGQQDELLHIAAAVAF